MDKRYGRMQAGQGTQTTGGLSERDMLQDMLVTEKYLSEVLNHAILEANSNQTRQVFRALQDNAQGHAHTIYDTMSDQGWYNVEQTSVNNEQNRYGRAGMGAGSQTSLRGRENRSYHGQGRNTLRGSGQQTYKTF